MQNRPATILLWLVAGAVLLASAALALRLLPAVSLEALGALALGSFVMGGFIAFALHLAKRQRASSARAVERIDAALRVLAQQTGHVFSDGGGYSHPMVGVIPYSGRVVGSCGPLRFKMFVTDDEGDFELTLSIAPVPGKQRRLDSRGAELSPRAASLVAALKAVCDRIAVESTVPWGSGGKRQPSDIDFELVCRASDELDELLAAERLRFILENALALAQCLAEPRR